MTVALKASVIILSSLSSFKKKVMTGVTVKNSTCHHAVIMLSSSKIKKIKAVNIIIHLQPYSLYVI